jgi:hypothetical protein
LKTDTIKVLFNTFFISVFIILFVIYSFQLGENCGNAGFKSAVSKMQKEAIANGAGHYDAITGEFKWGPAPK